MVHKKASGILPTWAQSCVAMHWIRKTYHDKWPLKQWHHQSRTHHVPWLAMFATKRDTDLGLSRQALIDLYNYELWPAQFWLIYHCSHSWLSHQLNSSSALRWRHNGSDSISNHQPNDCLLNRLFGADQSKHQSSASLAFVWGIHRGPVNFPHKWPVTRKMFPFDDVIMD